MIAELQTERQRLDEAIQALERLSATKSRRRGRPPRWLKEQIQRQNANASDSDEEETPEQEERGANQRGSP